MTRFATENGIPSAAGTIPPAELATIAKDNPGQAFVASPLMRPGFQEFLQELEYERYTPDTPANIKFELFIVRWADMPFAVAAFPLEDLPRARELAKKFNIELKEGLTLVCIGPEGSLPPFPIEDAPNLLIASGIDISLTKADRAKKTLERERELKLAYKIGAEEGPPKA